MPLLIRAVRFVRASLSGATLEERLYRTVCLLASVVTLLVIFPANQFQHLSIVIDIATIVFGVLTLGLYWASQRGHRYPGLLFFLLLLLLTVTWLADGGSDGSISYFFFAACLFPAVFFRGATRWLMLLIVVALGSGLHAAAYLYPQMVIPFATPFDRTIDVMTGFVIALMTCFLALMVVVASFDDERLRQRALNRELGQVLELNRRRAAELEQSLEEIKTLQGLLPICARCKKIRDEAGNWHQLESYVSHRTGATFSHGVCPECLRTYESEG